MDCEQATALLSAQLDHECQPDDRVLLEAHLNQCPTCAATAEAFRLQDADLQRAFAPRRQAVAATAEEVITGLRATAAPVTHRFWRFPMSARLLRYPGRLGMVLGAAAALAAVALFLHLWQHRPTGNTNPETVIQGGAASGSWTLGDQLTPRPRPDAPAAQPFAVGESIQTRTAERRRVTLPEGSILYINENSRVELASPRHLKLFSGEVFVEVSPRQANTDGSTFVIQTPNREVVALGTKFAVKAEAKGTGVVVTQGKVKVSGLSDVVSAGQQLAPGSARPVPAQRASHVLDWTRDLVVAAESPLVPRSNYCGGALIALDPWGQEARLSLRKYHVDVHIEDGFARTTIDQTYFNHNAWRMEGTFYFPLPADASLSRLAMYVANGTESTLMEGGMAERDYARQVFEQIMYTQRDPALLEWLDGSTFKMRVFPLEGRQEKRIILSYTQKLDSVYGRTAYRFPAGHSMQLVKEWSFEARIKRGDALGAKCSSHEMSSRVENGDLVLRTQARNVKPDKDVTFDFAASDESNSPAARFSSSIHEGHQYLMLRYRPNLPGQAQKQRRDWVFLFESSGDRDPLTARVQIDVIRNLLANAEHDDTFAIVTAATRVKTVTPTQPVTQANIKNALEALERTHLIGALDLGKALAAVQPLLQAGKDPCLVHVGSGIPALGERKEDVLAKRLAADVPYVGVGVGKRWSRNFMKMAAERTGGAFTQINPDEPVAWRSFELFSVLNTPRLQNVRVVDNAEKAVFLSYNNSLAQGEELCAIARMGKDSTDLPVSVTISGVLDGKTWTENVPVVAVTPRADYLPRTWAKLEIDRLLAEDTEKNKKAIIDLSKAMYVMTPFTSLLVLENEAMYKQFNVDRGRKDHWAMYDCPAKIPTVYEPDPSQGVDFRNAPRNVTVTRKPEAEQILRTIMVRLPARFFAGPNPNGDQAVTALQMDRMAYAIPELTDDMNMVQDKPGQGQGAAKGVPFTLARGTLPPVPTASPMNGAAAAKAAIPPGLLPQNEFDARALRQNGVPMMDGLRRRREMAIDERSAGGDQLSLQNRFRADWDRAARFGGRSARQEFMEFEQAAQGKEEARKRVAEKSKERDGTMIETIVSRLMTGYGYSSLVYQRPAFGGDDRIFSDLLSYAPGMNTSRADIQAVLEAEAAADPSTAPGTIEPAAQKLIDRARAASWRALTIPAHEGQAEFTIIYDGTGRYSYDRILPEGLREQVVCDGKTLLHLYPELGIAARRTVSRFHRAEFANLIGELVPPAEDLAMGHDLETAGDRMVSVLPRNLQAKGTDGKPVNLTGVYLIFAEDGRLVERQVVELPAKKTLYRVTYAADGTVKLFDSDNKVIADRASVRKNASAPDLAPDVKKLVVLPMPYRTWQHLWQVHGIKGNYVNLEESAALALLASCVCHNNQWNPYRGNEYWVYEQRFHNRGVRLVGFHTLLASGGVHKQNQQFWQRVRGEFGQEPLGKYMAIFDPQRQPNVPLGDIGGARDGFVQRLAAFRDLYVLWNSGKALEGDAARKNQERDRALEYVRQNRTSVQGWGMLSLLREKLGSDKGSQKLLAEACKLFENTPGLAYAARYEYARSLFADGQTAQARKLWLDLYNQTLADGTLPLIDTDFRKAFTTGDKDGTSFQDLLRQTAANLLKQDRRPTVMALASQCRQLDEPALADEFLEAGLKDVADKDRLATTLAGVEYLWQSGQQARADELLQKLLADPKAAENAALWHLASGIATQQRKLGRAVACLDKALEIEYRHMPAVVNVQTIRNDYGQLLNAYYQVAHALQMLDREPDKEFVAKVVRAADRWRTLDPDNAQVCHTAARILKSVGATELAWDYMTTPVALKPNDAAPHLTLAQTLRNEGEIDLADRAYAVAFEVEGSNAQILWERAQMLQQAGRTADALNIYRKIADGSWRTQFQWIQQQARWQLGIR